MRNHKSPYQLIANHSLTSHSKIMLHSASLYKHLLKEELDVTVAYQEIDSDENPI